jgi:hypothetical protein
MTVKPFKPFFGLAVLMVIISLACSFGGGGNQPAATQAPEKTQAVQVTQAPTEPPVTCSPGQGDRSSGCNPWPAAPGAVSSLMTWKMRWST